MQKIAFIGLGVMGGPMAAHLARRGHSMVVYNRSAPRARAWVERHGGRVADCAQDAAQGADCMITCVGNDEDLRSVLLSQSGALAGMKPGAIAIDHTTASADLARQISTHAAGLGLGFLDAPVSGGQRGAEEGVLSIMAGGHAEHFERARGVMSAYGRTLALVGPSGSGQLAKMVNQICAAGLLQGLAEGLAFGAKAGLDMQKVLGVISQGAAGSWQLSNRAQTMLERQFEFGFAVNWMRKDLSICLAEASRIDARLPITALIDQFYAQIQARGGGRLDTSSLIQLLWDESAPDVAT